jgi:proteasome assembly chaperone (PAC2) family protein
LLGLCCGKQGKEIERYACDSKSIEELAENLAEHGLYPRDYDGGNVVGHLGLLEDERDDI